MMFKPTLFGTLLALAMAAGAASPVEAQGPAGRSPFAPYVPSRPARQDQVKLHLDGVNAVQLAWWFQHIADDDGRYWRSLAPGANSSIQWRVNPREDAHQLIGSLFTSDQKVPGDVFPGGVLHTQAQFQDYVTERGGTPAGQPPALNLTVAIPKDYKPAYPSPLAGGFGSPLDPGQVNGFNEQLLLTDGHGFSQGRLLMSWKNSGSDDTQATAGRPLAVDLTLTLYQYWMEGPNRPPARSADDYYYSPAQVRVLTGLWATMLKALPAELPRWFNEDTQDDVARAKGWTVGSEIDTGFVEGVDSRMMVWWWNHAMGDAPGINYSFWAPPAHYAIRWLPGYSPAEVLKSPNVPTDHVVPGIIYPDLQGDHFEQTGGGMMSYPPERSPIPGKYKTIDPMFVLTKEQVDNFVQDRFPPTQGWLLHQWEDRPGGMIHRSTVLNKLPLRSPVTQQGYYSEHQLIEGQFWGTSGMRKAYFAWLESQKPTK